ncbi:MAG: acetylglutamate kinase [Bryobacter sp.]|nr:acetylglutamate kinase [Bryobacter sp.]
MITLVKFGGSLLDDAGSRAAVAAQLRELPAAVVVHGGGKQMTRFLAERGVESRFVEGLRVTTPEVVDAVLKVFAGSVNHDLVAACRAAGMKPVGLTGIDAGLTRCEQLDARLGAVGRVTGSEGRLLELLVTAGYLPVIACVGGDDAGNIYNVNADQMAVACAAGCRAARLWFLTDVDGVRDGAGAVAPVLDAAGARKLIEDGVATGGMQAKLNAALSALEQGIEEVRIVPGARPGILAALAGGEAVGTRMVAAQG